MSVGHDDHISRSKGSTIRVRATRDILVRRRPSSIENGRTDCYRPLNNPNANPDLPTGAVAHQTERICFIVPNRDGPEGRKHARHSQSVSKAKIAGCSRAKHSGLRPCVCLCACVCARSKQTDSLTLNRQPGLAPGQPARQAAWQGCNLTAGTRRCKQQQHRVQEKGGNNV